MSSEEEEDTRSTEHRHKRHKHEHEHENEKVKQPKNWDDLGVFDVYAVPANLSGIVYGARGSGKTSWITWFLYFHQFTYTAIYVLSSTAFTGHYQKFLPHHHVFPEYREDVVQMVIDHKKTNTDGYVLVILDDVLDAIRDIRKSRALYTLFTMGRHMNIGVLVGSQYALALVPAFRRNCDIAVIFGSHSVDTFDQLFKEYGHHMSRTEFQKLCERYCMTPYYSCLVVLPTVRSHHVKDIYKFSIATQKDVRPFFIGEKKRKHEELSNDQQEP
jgi:hypothetical protein